MILGLMIKDRPAFFKPLNPRAWLYLTGPLCDGIYSNPDYCLKVKARQMENENSQQKDTIASEKDYQLLEEAEKGNDITVRDDIYDFYWLMDSVKLCRQKGCRFRLIDTGVFDFSHLERLAESGVDLYASDRVRQSVPELELINKASKKGNAIMAYFCHGNIKDEEEEGTISFSSLLNLGRCGIYIHITNREKTRDFSQLKQMAYQCRLGGSWLVYYHHGHLDPDLVELAANSSWIHVSDQSIREDEDAVLLREIAKSSLSVGTSLVLYLEKGVDFIPLSAIIKAGAFVFFKSGQIDYKSPFKPLAELAGKRKLDFRACYLYPTFMQ